MELSLAPRKVGKMSLWRYDDIEKLFGFEGGG